MLKRKVYDRLLQWKELSQGATAVLIEGARRIGKSYIAEEFARREYDSYILIDFSKAPPQVKEWFDLYMEDLDTLLMNIQLHYKKRLTPRKSVIIFDEVQDCPRARAAIKHLVKDGRFDYIETGSLISIRKNVKGILIPSEEDAIDMYPMDFEEFLWAMGDDMLMPFIRQRFEQQLPMGDFHRRAMDLFRQYMIVGGMPQAVLAYTETRITKDISNIVRTHDLDFERLWLNFNRTDRSIMISLSKGVNPLQNRKVATSTSFSGIKRLMKNGYVIRGSDYEIEDPFFKEWIIRFCM